MTPPRDAASRFGKEALAIARGERARIDADIQRTLGEQSEAIRGLREDIHEMKESNAALAAEVALLTAAMNKTRGGWAVLATVATTAAAIGAAAAQIWEWIKDLRAP